MSENLRRTQCETTTKINTKIQQEHVKAPIVYNTGKGTITTTATATPPSLST